MFDMGGCSGDLQGSSQSQCSCSVSSQALTPGDAEQAQPQLLRAEEQSRHQHSLFSVCSAST